jgi:peptidoglycan hydrolase-like protein with peptidoglycan-binding domain
LTRGSIAQMGGPTAEIQEATFSTEQRSKLASKGHALSDGSYPIRNASDLRNAIQAIGRAKDQARAKRHIIKRAKALGLTSMLPEGWGSAVQEAWFEAIELLADRLQPSDDEIAIAEAALALDEDELEEAKKGSPDFPIPNKPGKTNWVEKAGGLPTYIRHIAEDIAAKHGGDVSRAIAIAVGQVKNWCHGHGGNVTAKTRAKACAALAEWDAKRAKSKLSEAEVEEWLDEWLAIAEADSPESPADDWASPEEIEFAHSLAEALGEESGSEMPEYGSGTETHWTLTEATAGTATPPAPGNTNGTTMHFHIGGSEPPNGPGRKPSGGRSRASGGPQKAAGEPQGAAPAAPPAAPQGPQTATSAPPAQPPAQAQPQPVQGQSTAAALTLQPGLGRADERVTKLQARLTQLGFEVKEDGVYSDLTTKAVRDFQTSVGLDPSGAVDEATIGALRAAQAAEAAPDQPVTTAVVRPGESGDSIRRVQDALHSSGYDVGGAPSGTFDRSTELAVKRFQREHGLKADGIVGRHTARMIDATAKTERAQARLAEATYERTHAADGYEFYSALARERAARVMVEAACMDVGGTAHHTTRDYAPEHTKGDVRKRKQVKRKKDGEPVTEASFTEVLHPRGRTGRFIDKPHEPRSRSQKWYETPRVAPGGMPRPLLPHGSDPPEPTSGKANFSLQLRSGQGGAFGISPTKSTEGGIPAAVGIEGLKPFHSARVGKVSTMQTKDLKLAMAKAREYGSRTVQRKIGAELVTRGVLKSQPDVVSGLRHPGSPMTSKPDTIRGRLAALATTKPGDAGLAHGSVTDSVTHGKPQSDPHQPQSRYSGPLMKGAGPPSGTTAPQPAKRSPGVTERRARFPSLEQSIRALGVGQQTDLGHGVLVHRREGGYRAELGGKAIDLGRQNRAPSAVAAKVNRAMSASIGQKVLAGSSGAPDLTSAAKASPPIEKPLNTLDISQLAALADEDWVQVSPHARPYLDAMKSLTSTRQAYGADRGSDIVMYFLSNATSWRGDVARKVKAELKRRVRR